LKRWFALVLSIVVMLTLALPMQSFAANMDQSLENAIKIAKTKFVIPDTYKFSSTISIDDPKDGTKKMFYLSWNNPDATSGGNISVNIDENGRVMSYYRYSPSDYTTAKKLPKISRQDARKKADEYIKKIDLTLLSKLKYDDSTQNNNLDSSYNFTYYRVENGLPVFSNQASLSISRETGALQNYNLNWTDDLAFPSLTGIITEKKAEDFYKSNLGLKMIYKYSYIDNVLKAYAVYSPMYDNTGYAVDAFTGERLQLDYNYYGMYYDKGVGNSAMKSSKGMGGAAEVTLNPDELKAVEDAGKLITVEQAEKIVRSTAFLGLTDDFKLSNSNLNQNWPVRTSYVWNLYFNKEAKDTTDSYNDYMSISIDAKTGEIVSFDKSNPYKEGVTAKYDLNASKAAVEKFLNDNYPVIKKQLVYDELKSSNSQFYGKVMPPSINFKYNRLANGIEFPDNGVTINYDTVNGTITNFNLIWFETTFPAIDKVLPIADVYGKLFANVGLELQYKMKTPEMKINTPEMDSKIIPVPTPQTKPDMKAVYALKPNKPFVFDANTGDQLDGEGKIYKEPKPVSYTDIAGNAAEKQIMVLAENGIYLEGTEFKPKAAILQKDFLSLIMKTLNNYYYGPVITPNSTKEEVATFYANLSKEGIVYATEKAPDSAVTREDAVKFIIRALKYDKVADIKGIYNCSYKDKSEINPSLIGYVTIAAGLKIDTGLKGYFNPKAKLTRANAAVMIYNYLQVQV